MSSHQSVINLFVARTFETIVTKMRAWGRDLKKLSIIFNFSGKILMDFFCFSTFSPLFIKLLLAETRVHSDGNCAQFVYRQNVLYDHYV